MTKISAFFRLRQRRREFQVQLHKQKFQQRVKESTLALVFKPTTISMPTSTSITSKTEEETVLRQKNLNKAGYTA